jgi:flagellar FliL protein
MATAKEAKPHDDRSNSTTVAGETSPGAHGATTTAATAQAAFLKFGAKSPIVAALVAVVLVLGALPFLFQGREESTAAVAGLPDAGYGAGHPVFYDVPDILVNMASDGEKPAFLKLALSLELEGADARARAAIDPVLPRVIDQLQTYLRELRIEDLNGSAAVFRLKEEMLRRVNLAIEPIKVKDVLFREMIIQ